MTAWLVVALTVALVGANAVLVAVEFASVTLRRQGLEGLDVGGGPWASRALKELPEVADAVAITRIAAAVASILLGVLGAGAVADVLVAPALAVFGIDGAGPARVTSLALLAAILVVLGELVPRSVAIARPVVLLRFLSPLVRPLTSSLAPPLRWLDRLGRTLLERVLKVGVGDRSAAGHSLEELARIIDASGEEGSLSSEQTSLLSRAVALGDRRVEEVMVPRPDVVWLATDDTLADLAERARATGFSRFPVHGDHEDEVLGSVHVRDLLAVPSECLPQTSLRQVLTPMLIVPEAARLRRLLAEFRREQRTAAIVIDEHGGTVGLVTLEDVLEELVGDIEDEFDGTGIALRRRGQGRTSVDGRIRLDRAAALFGEPLPDGPYETLAGFVLDQLGHIPRVGEVVPYGGLELRVSRMEGTRITEVEVRQLGGEGAAP